ncbi:unnamed protein product [Paramecium pentaurelia]|uniref:Tetratricopeptide repeat protein n=1 Tax=Paramecium pentaurelia TaxID=43138 RepID=A0A8S1V051_9CILI|nr:unnamed protein product [Paramecium pentaurelia]
MNQIKELQIKCSIEEHDDVELACFNQQCKANRVYCHQCLRNGDHIAHIKDQKNIKELIEFFNKVEQENEDLIQKLSLMLGEIIELFTQLNQGLEQKYKFSKKRLQKLNAKQLNQVLDQVLKYDEITKGLFEDIQKSSDDMIIQLKGNIKDLKLEEANSHQQNKQEQEKLEKFQQLYQKGYKLYYDDNKYEEAIEVIDAALLIDPNHVDSLFIKADSLKMLQDYREAIIWAEKALSINSNHLNSLSSKGDSLRILGKYNEALMILDKALNINSNHDISLARKGACLQSLSKYQQAIICYIKALQINPDYQWAKNKQAECKKQLYLKYK